VAMDLLKMIKSRSMTNHLIPGI